MNQEVFKMLVPVEVGDNVLEKVRELVKKLPAGAHGMQVIVFMKGMWAVEGATVANLPLRFDPPIGEKTEGMVTIGYGVGNLE